MGTVIKPELSKKNKYWIERHRFYELKHFCLQYPIWKKERDLLITTRTSSVAEPIKDNVGNVSDSTAEMAIKREFYNNRIEMVEKAAREADSELADYVLKGVTDGVRYDLLRLRTNIPCCRDTYYEAYRRFFWILDKMRQ